VKNADPNALVVGPEEWGWMGYFYSGYDQQWSSAHSDWNPGHFPDRGTNGGLDYVPWLLSQFRKQEVSTQRRLLDYCTLHVYPQGGEFGNDVSTPMQLRRNRSTRQLWDTNYVDPTWIGSVVKLIPRLKEWVTNYYPGTRIGITEYNWGAEGHINGATAQADIYGIFGREGLDLATRWTTPAASSPTFKAMKMFRNCDGANSGFGDVSIYAGGPNPDNVSVFGAIRSTDGALTLLLINKQLTAAAAIDVNITNQPLSDTGQVWQLTAANVIRRLADLSFSSTGFTNNVPPQSITLYVLAPREVTPPTLRAGAVTPGTSFELWVDGARGRPCVLESTTNLLNWSAIQTNTSTGDPWHVILPSTDPIRTFYRARLTN
jgi:hypothetical protein